MSNKSLKNMNGHNASIYQRERIKAGRKHDKIYI